MNSLKSTRFGMAALLALALFGCGTADVATGESDEDLLSDELNTTTPSYVYARRDMRKCTAPMCGGWYVRDANKRTAEQYVSDFDFSSSGLDADQQAIVRGAADGEVVVLGKLTRLTTRIRFRKFVVESAWRGMPGRTWTTNAKLYSIKDIRPLIRCFAAPCNGLNFTVLNVGASGSATSLSVGSASGPFVDETWLDKEVTREDALVVATIVNGQQFPAGPEQVIDAQQVFVKLPETMNCPQFKLAACPRGQFHGYERNTDRCVMPTGCTRGGRMCAQFIPSCEEGYELISWMTASGCAAYACDPTWSR